MDNKYGSRLTKDGAIGNTNNDIETCIQCNQKEPMVNDDLCSTCSSDNYFREMSFTQELKELCGVCGNKHDYSEAYCDDNASSCGGCGEWIFLSTNHICLPELDAKLESEAN